MLVDLGDGTLGDGLTKCDFDSPDLGHRRTVCHGRAERPHVQKIWKDRMIACLANPRSDELWQILPVRFGVHGGAAVRTKAVRG
jgi:hypothetical protein